MYKCVLSIVTVLLIASYSTKIIAQDYIHLGMYSNHFKDADKNLNEKHNLIGIEINNHFIYSYQNSKNRRSIYAGIIRRDWACIKVKWCLGYNYGIMSGYGSPVPVLFPVFSYTNDQAISFDLTCIYDIVCAIQARLATSLLSDNSHDMAGYMEFAIDHADPDARADWGYGRSNGIMVGIKLYLNESLFLRLDMTDTEFNVEPERDYPIDASVFWWGYPASTMGTKRMYAVGKEYQHNDDIKLSLIGSFNTVNFQSNFYNRETNEFTSLPEKTYTGFGLHAGVNYQIAENHSFYLEVGLENTLILDVKLIGEYRYKFSDNVEFIIRTEDYDKWNYSKYQFGIRYNF